MTTPSSVRIGSSLLLGGAVASMALPLSPGVRAALLCIFAACALLLIFNHPYRREVKNHIERAGGEHKTTITQVFPLFPPWIALMVLPAIQSSFTFQLILTGVAFLAAAGYSYIVIPHIDGTARLKRTPESNN